MDIEALIGAIGGANIVAFAVAYLGHRSKLAKITAERDEARDKAHQSFDETLLDTARQMIGETLADLRREVAALRNENGQLRTEVSTLRDANADLHRTIDRLTNEVEQLTRQLARGDAARGDAARDTE